MSKGISAKDLNLLKITGCFIILALVFNFFLKPVAEEQKTLQASLDALEVQQIQMESLINNAELKNNMETQKTEAMQNYEYFYGVLNSYTVDGIINDLVTEENLEITSLTIGDYSQAAEEKLVSQPEVSEEVLDETETEDGETTPQETMLMACNATSTISGDYNNLLSFIDKLSQKSDCIEFGTLTLSADSNMSDVSYDEYGDVIPTSGSRYSMTFAVNLFGIDNSSITELQALQEEAKNSSTPADIPLKMDEIEKNEFEDDSLDSEIASEYDEEFEEEEFVDEPLLEDTVDETYVEPEVQYEPEPVVEPVQPTPVQQPAAAPTEEEYEEEVSIY